MADIVQALAEHAFEHLFIECLGWDRVRTQVVVQHDGLNVELNAVAHKRGFTVFLGETHRTVLADRRALRRLQQQLRQTHHEHILIHCCQSPRKQVWQWATAVAPGQALQHREHPFFSDQPPPRLLERLRGLAVSLDEEEQTSLPDVLVRVRQALLPDSEFNLFAQRPWYARRSDALATAMRRGEPGAFDRFVELHLPLARKASKMLVRWFNMEPDDAVQTATIGLIEAARRFDPERGFQFSTYAGYWIRQRCQRHGMEWGLAIRLPVHWFWPCYRLQYVEAELNAAYGARESRERFERAREAAGVSAEQWQTFCQARRLDCFTDADARRQELLGQPDGSNVERAATSGETSVNVEKCLKTLLPRQARILKLRYGIGHRPHTLQEVAKKLGVTRERVRQIQIKAEEKLQRALLRSGYRDLAVVEPAGKQPVATKNEEGT